MCKTSPKRIKGTGVCFANNALEQTREDMKKEGTLPATAQPQHADNCADISRSSSGHQPTPQHLPSPPKSPISCSAFTPAARASTSSPPPPSRASRSPAPRPPSQPRMSPAATHDLIPGGFSQCFEACMDSVCDSLSMWLDDNGQQQQQQVASASSSRSGSWTDLGAAYKHRRVPAPASPVSPFHPTDARPPPCQQQQQQQPARHSTPQALAGSCSMITSCCSTRNMSSASSIGLLAPATASQAPSPHCTPAVWPPAGTSAFGGWAVTCGTVQGIKGSGDALTETLPLQLQQMQLSEQQQQQQWDCQSQPVSEVPMFNNSFDLRGSGGISCQVSAAPASCGMQPLLQLQQPQFAAGIDYAEEDPAMAAVDMELLQLLQLRHQLFESRLSAAAAASPRQQCLTNALFSNGGGNSSNGSIHSCAAVTSVPSAGCSQDMLMLQGADTLAGFEPTVAAFVAQHQVQQQQHRVCMSAVEASTLSSSAAGSPPGGLSMVAQAKLQELLCVQQMQLNLQDELLTLCSSSQDQRW